MTAAVGLHDLTAPNLMRMRDANHAISGVTTAWPASTPVTNVGGLPTRLGWRDALLLLGFAGMLLVAAVNLLAGDLLSSVYVAAAVAGVVFLHRRLLPAVVWTAVAAMGALASSRGEIVAVPQVVLGLALAAVAATPSRQSASDQTPEPAAGLGQTASSPPTDLGRAGAGTRLQIQTIGSFAVRWQEQDLTSALFQHRVLAYLWLYLLVRALAEPGSTITRSALADELSPGLSAVQQRTRLRSQLYDLQHDLPECLSCRILGDGHRLHFDLAGCEVDYSRLQGLEKQCRGSSLISQELLEELQGSHDRFSNGEFFPGWEELEQRINDGRGTAGDLVLVLRRRADEMRASLAAALARTYLAAGQPDLAVEPLRQGLRHSPEREDLAQGLVTAYMQSGRPQLAAQVNQRYQSGEEV